MKIYEHKLLLQNGSFKAKCELEAERAIDGVVVLLLTRVGVGAEIWSFSSFIHLESLVDRDKSCLSRAEPPSVTDNGPSMWDSGCHDKSV